MNATEVLTHVHRDLRAKRVEDSSMRHDLRYADSAKVMARMAC